MGAAFHWMDRDQTLRDLDHLALPGGAVVLASGGAPGDVEPAPWPEITGQIRTRYLGPQRRAGSGTYAHPTERHQDVLARSPFPHVETARWDRTITRTLDQVVGLQFSCSYSSPAQLGPHKDAFEHDLRQALADFSPRGPLRRTDPHRGHHRHSYPSNRRVRKGLLTAPSPGDAATTADPQPAADWRTPAWPRRGTPALPTGVSAGTPRRQVACEEEQRRALAAFLDGWDAAGGTCRLSAVWASEGSGGRGEPARRGQ
ncbi:hypothetical protein GA0115259_1016413 [Streptomyces sp. MnatMP-M17]|nr:hypothetical protein GA0115259_1016413 [Streptomyces sp. MnatMP-M17]